MIERIRIEKGDITAYKISAIVNAANSRLAGGGGVDGAIHRKAGNDLSLECRRIISEIKECEAGNAVLTSGFCLTAEYIIHAVGPIYTGNIEIENQILYNAYKNSLIIAERNDFETIAFPNISTGAYGFPKQEACEIAFNAIIDFLKNNNKPANVIFVCYDDENYNIYIDYFKKLKQKFS